MTTIEEDPCPDCGTNKDAHEDGCPRINTLGQIGPPWKPGPWKKWCNFSDGSGFICMLSEGHSGDHSERFTGE